MNQAPPDQRSLLQALLSDGRPLLIFTGLSLVLSGCFALFLAATGHFLPHDIQFLGMTTDQLCAINGCRVVHFMLHDRVAFGGSLIAIGALYMWLAEFPLSHREGWSWWLFVITGCAGFGSFLTYLGYGYLDMWHGIATLFLLPCFVVGLTKSFFYLTGSKSIRTLLTPGVVVPWKSSFGLGRALLLGTALGMVLGGVTIMTVGMTSVFVPQDLEFMGVTAGDLHAINPRLVPLIAHDRAGFGGGIGTCGLAVLFCVWCGRPSKSLWQVLCFSGAVGFATAIGVHPVVGYNNLFHLAPAIVGAVMFIIGLGLCYGKMCKPAVDEGKMLSATQSGTPLQQTVR